MIPNLQTSVHVVWEGVPNYIAAVAGALTFLVALLAARFAYLAWRAAEAQSIAGGRQAGAAEEQLAIAKEQAALLTQQVAEQAQRELAVRRREVMARIDAIAPNVLAEATIQPLLMRDITGARWEPVIEQLTLEGGDNRQFRMGATIRLRNLSAHVARVSFPQAGNGELSVGSGQELIIEPGEDTEVSWFRRFQSEGLRTPEHLALDHVSTMRHEVWVRDLGINVRDSFAFALDLRYFDLDGSRLIVRPTVLFPTQLTAAEPTGPRVYERLEGDAEMSSPIGRLDV